MKIEGVQPAQFPDVYPHIRWAFESFAGRDPDGSLPEDIAGQVLAQTSQCWVAFDDEIKAVALSEVRDGRAKSVLMTHCAGRDRQTWQEPLVEEIRNWARSIGATRFGTVNRPGWTPFLRKMGLQETHRLMEQEL